jgi:hypothetical protein
MTRLTIDLSTILQQKYPKGFYAPADIPIDTFLEYTDDVHEVRPDLTVDEAWEVLQCVEKWHDANHGICWYTLEAAAEMLFSEPTCSTNRKD